MASTPQSAKLIRGTSAPSLIYVQKKDPLSYLIFQLSSAGIQNPSLSSSWQSGTSSPTPKLPSHAATPSPLPPNARRLSRPTEYPPTSAPAARFPASIPPAPKSGTNAVPNSLIPPPSLHVAGCPPLKNLPLGHPKTHGSIAPSGVSTNLKRSGRRGQSTTRKQHTSW